MDNRYMTEMSLEDQQNVGGGDWIDSSLALAEAIAMMIGML